MATTNFTCNKDARIAESGATSLGAGASDFNPIGLYGGYLYRTLLGFSYSFSGMVSITNAVLHFRTSTQYYVAFGSDPDINVRRLSASWSEGTAVSLSGTNAVEWDNQPGVTGSTVGPTDISTSESTWDSINITTIMQEALAAGVFYGLRLWADNEGSTSDCTEIYSREQGSSDPYIVITYTNNVVPSAPTQTGPAASEIVTPTPTIAFTHVDSDGDALSTYDLQVTTDPTFATATHWDTAGAITGISGNNVSLTYGGTALTRGVTYYWRARTTSATGTGGVGAWSAGRAFVVNSLPVASLTEPGATGRTARVVYSPGAGWASPRLVVAWGSTDADAGHSQVKYQVFIKNDADGSTHYDSGTVVSTVTSLTIPTTVVEGNKYRIKVLVWDQLEQGAYSTELTVRARWAEGVYRYDMTAAPTSITLSTLSTTTGSSSEVSVEYGTNTTTTTPGTFYSTVGGVPLQRYFFYRVYLYAWGSATPTSPSLDQLTISYSAIVLLPDNWTRSDTTPGVIIADPGSYVYGSQALRIAPNGAKAAYQSVPVLPNTDYVLSGRIKSLGNSSSYLQLLDTAQTTVFGQSAVTSATQDFTAIEPVVWNSGAATNVTIRCYADGASGTFAWFDALKLEASSVATPWTPGFIGTAVGIDAGGVQIDASAGGLFRLRGSTGGTRDTVALDTKGLLFGGDANLYSDTANVLKTDDSFNVAGSALIVPGVLRKGGSAFPGSPTTGDTYFRTDLGREFYWTGSYWMTTQLYETPLGVTGGAMPLTVSTGGYLRGPAPLREGASDVYISNYVVDWYVAGGTALSGSHKWACDLYALGAASAYNFGPATISSGNLNEWNRTLVAVNDLLYTHGFTPRQLQVDFTKTGTPGSLYPVAAIQWRMIAT